MELNIEKISKELARLGWTQTELASRVGITKAAVSYILKAKSARFKTIEKLAGALDMEAKDLLR